MKTSEQKHTHTVRSVFNEGDKQSNIKTAIMQSYIFYIRNELKKDCNAVKVVV